MFRIWMSFPNAIPKFCMARLARLEPLLGSQDATQVCRCPLVTAVWAYVGLENLANPIETGNDFEIIGYLWDNYGSRMG